MVAIKISEIIGFKVKDGPFDGNVFTQFISEILITHFLMHPNDNCRFHKRSDIINLFNQHSINHRFLPPYSPQVSPIEEYFSYFKSGLNSRENIIRKRNDNKLKILEILSEEFADFSGWFRNMRRYVKKALSRRYFI